MPAAGRSRRSAGDLTGRRAEELAQQAQAEQEKRQGSIAMATGPAEVIVDDGALIDLTNPHQPVVRSLDSDDLAEDERRELESTRARGQDVVEVGGIEVQEQTRLMRVAEKCDPVIGFGPNGPNEYHFEPGKLYRVPAVVYDHLDSIGYVYH